MSPLASLQQSGHLPAYAGVISLGSTGLRVSRIGLGLAGLGRPVYMSRGRDTDLGSDRSVAAMRRRCHELLDAAHLSGVRYVDTARSYGLAEQFLNGWWDDRRLPDTALTVGSKWGYTYTGSWRRDVMVHEVKKLSIDTLRRQVVESKVILGPRLDLYQIHSATVESGVLDDREVLSELARLRGRGLCIGLTVTGPRQAETIRRAIRIQIDGLGLFQTVQATWNLLEPSAAASLAEARAAGCGVIVKEVLANGRLTSRHGGAALREIRAHAASLGTTVETLAVAAALAQPWADVVLSGAVRPEQLHAHLDGLLFNASLRFASIAEPAETYWRKRNALPWT